ncbi:MAG TPA: tetratricopeptide repeat protein [Candidatus Aminicenantes bacterium]|nr:tetratricopeptide repeat protein [Candidatus Aminicenantes bacterium]
MNAKQRTAAWVLAAGAVAAAAAAAWFLAGPGRPSAPARIGRLWAKKGTAKPNVILVTLDTTRADHLGCYGGAAARTPVLDGLARRGVLFEQAATASPLTLPAHSTILTGMYPTYHGVRVNGNTALNEDQTTLAEVFAARGYDCGAFVAAFVVDGRWGLKQGFGTYDDRLDMTRSKHIDLGAIQRPGNEVLDSALGWLDGRRDRPFFAWIHLYDPHLPYEPPEPYRSEYAGAGPAGLYSGEIAFMDEQVGRLTAWLDRTGLDRTTVLVLVGDHGEGLGDHAESAHGFFIYDSTLHVPLIVVAPLDGLAGKRVPAQVSTADLFPTILDLAGLSGVGEVQGRSLVRRMFRPGAGRETPAYGESMAPNIQFGWSPLHVLRTSRWKYIDAPRAELFDIAADPGERVNLASREPGVVRAMKAGLDRLMDETGRGAPAPQAANLDRETMERLTALGYVGAPVAARKASGASAPLADPKDKLAVFERVTAAGGLVTADKYAEAVPLLETALAEEPGIPQAMLVLSTCYKELGRPEEAKAMLDMVLKDDPENLQALISLANILLDEGRDDDVLALCKQALNVDETNTQALQIVGEIHMGRLEFDQALPYIEKAADVQAKNDRSRFNLAACLIGLGQFDRAEPILRAVLEASPKWPLARFNLGLLCEERGRLEEARAAYAQEVETYPSEFKARFNLGKLLFKLGDRAGSLAEMRQVVKLTPKLAEGHLFLARGLLYEDVPLEEVEASAERGLALADTPELKAMGCFLLADVYNRMRRPDKMEEALRRARAFQAEKESR